MDLSKLLSPTAWALLSVANVFFAGASIATGNYAFVGLNVLSAAGCYLGYLLSKHNS